MQSEFDASEVSDQERASAVRMYSSGFFEIKARQIEAWSEKSEARELLAVLIRKLASHDLIKDHKVRFPGI